MKKTLHRLIPLVLVTLVAAAACSKHEEKQDGAASRNTQWKGETLGEELFNERCRDCHKVHDKGGVVGPDLSKIGGKRDGAYLEQAIREPSKLFPGTVMPPSGNLSVKQVNSLVDYLSKLK